MNLTEAKKALEIRLNNNCIEEENLLQSRTRQVLVGSGMRGDKIITLREQDNTVTNHINNKKCKYKDFIKGNLSILENKSL